ncbi:hypothetical protein, partial [Desulfobacterium sp. N47]
GENACYTLLAFICLKMELHWKSNPIGKVRENLPFFQKPADKNFTQKLDSTQNVANSILLGLSGSGQVQPSYWVDPKIGVQYLINVRAPEYAMDSIQELNAMPISAGKLNTSGTSNAQILSNLATLHRVYRRSSRIMT